MSNNKATRTSTHPRFVCGHCGESLSKTTYFKHRREYYNQSTDTWKTSNEESFFGIPDPFETSCSSDSDEDNVTAGKSYLLRHY